MGRVVLLAIEIDRNIALGLRYGPDDVTYHEMLLLRVLAEERNEYTEEVMNRSAKRRPGG